MIRCIECGQADLEPKTVRLQGSVRDETYTVEMQGLECPSCGYKTIEGAALPEFARLLADRYRAHHDLLTSEEIRALRKRLGMSQEQFARHVGVGLASVKRWEMGKIQEQHNNDRILQGAMPVATSVRAYVECFGAIYGSTIGYNWRISESVVPADLGAAASPTLAVQECFEDALRQQELWSRQNGTFSELELPSHRTLCIAAPFSQTGG